MVLVLEGVSVNADVEIDGGMTFTDAGCFSNISDKIDNIPNNVPNLQQITDSQRIAEIIDGKNVNDILKYIYQFTHNELFVDRVNKKIYVKDKDGNDSFVLTYSKDVDNNYNRVVSDV